MRPLFLGLFLATHFLYATSKSPQNYEANTCRKIILIGNKGELLSKKQLETVDGIEFYKIKVPGKTAFLAEQLENLFLNCPITKDTPLRIRRTVEEFYRNQDHPFVEVIIPQQEITQGVIQVYVFESRVAEVNVSGGKYTSPSLLKNYLGTTGQPIDTTQLRKNLDFMNRNPFRRVDLIYSPGKEPHTTDLSLIVEDRQPIRVYAGTDNSGVEITKRGRCFAGFNSAKVFGLDHFVSYQYTSSYNFHQFQANTLQYLALLPWRNILNVYGGYSSVYADLPFPGMKNHGHSYQVSARYILPITPSDRLNHEMGFGFDFKRTNNTIEFSEDFPVVGPNVNLSQFTLRYGGDFGKNEWQIAFDGELFFSPGDLLGDESNADYSALRPEAKNHWLYAKALFKFFQRLPQSFALSLIARGQISSQNLLPSEQIGLGGFDSVRGYDERELNYDGGIILNGEILTPTFRLFSNLWEKLPRDTLQFLGFVDFGYGGNHNAIPGEKKRDYLIGIGPGMRYLIDPWITARLDLGIKLHHESTFSGGNAMWYFSFTGSI